jgi:hypothetical protein
MKYFNKVRVDGELQSMTTETKTSKNGKQYYCTNIEVATGAVDADIVIRAQLITFTPPVKVQPGPVTLIGEVRAIYKEYPSDIKWHSIEQYKEKGN